MPDPNMPDPAQQFSENIRDLARTVLGIDGGEQGTLLGTLAHCAKTAGVPLGAAGGVAMAGAGSVTVPIVGAVPGWVVGAVGGFASGTAICTFAHRGVIHPAVRQILSSSNHNLHELRTGPDPIRWTG
jgi:hypothetical protein